MEPITLSILAAAAVAVIALPGYVVWRKGRPAAAGEVFRASRMTAGNRLFPTQVIITPHSVVHYTPQWIGRHEHSIHIAHVASVRIDTGLVFSDVVIETTGGSGSIHCRGHRKGDAIRMQQLIEEFQSAYYRATASGGASPVPVAAPLPAR
ncbi:MAG: hypothetical protein ACJ786_32410 [Catenulispora sp.]